MSARLDLKIFLSPPGDVSDERGLARRVLDRLSQEYALRNRIHLEEVSWDDPGAPVLVEFALEELYERSGGKQLTVAAYRGLGFRNCLVPRVAG